MRASAQCGWRKGALAAAVLCAYVLAAIGVLPSPEIMGRWIGVTTGTTERFPCEDHGCGCGSAAECWMHCCCHSEDERVAWAIGQGVMPPANVAISDAVWARAADRMEPRRAGDEHCAVCVVGIKDRVRRGVGIRPVRVARAGECEREHANACGESGGECGKKCDASETRGATGPVMSALSCKGVQQLLVVMAPPARLVGGAWVLPPRPMVEVVATVRDEACDSRELEVAEPPPKRVA